MSSEVIIRNCLFCAVPCATVCITENCEVKRVRIVKSESCSGDDDDFDADAVPPASSSSSSLSFLEEEENPLLGNQLKAFFILRNILNISESKLSEYLKMLDGQLHPEFWVEVCGPCGEVVGDYYQTLRLISKLKKKLVAISTQLKRSVWDSKDTSLCDGVGEDFNQKDDRDDSNHEEALNFLWRDIRNQALGDKCKLKPTDLEIPLPHGGVDENYNPPKPTKVSRRNRKRISYVKPKKGRKTLNAHSRRQRRKQGYEQKQKEDDKMRRQKTKTGSSISKDILGQLPDSNDVKMETEDDLIDESTPPPSPIPPPTSSPDNTDISSESEDEEQHNKPKLSKVTRRETRSTVFPRSKSSIFTRIQKLHKKGMKKATYKCSDCGFETSSPTKSKKHAQLHSSASIDGIPLVSCKHCRWVFPSDKIRYHTALYHTPKSYNKVVVDSITYYKCKLCPYKCKYSIDLKNHAKLHKPGSGAVVCSDCGWIGTPVRVRSHKIKCHPNEYQNELDAHYKTIKVGKDLKYMCRECGFHCLDKKYIHRHLELHKQDGPKSTSCSHCGWLVLATKINHHITARHPGQGNRRETKIRRKPAAYLKCPECGYLLCGRGYLTRHLKLHESGEGQVCEECGWLCTNVGQHRANWHPEEGTKKAKVREETKVKPVKTLNKEGEEEKEVDKKLEEDSNWNDPKCVEITHAYRTAFKCSACGLVKNKKPGLITHFKLHKEGSGAVKCVICGWLLAKARIKFHTNFYHGPNGVAKPVMKGKTHFKCELCGFYSIRRYSVKEHLELHEREEGTLCPECGWWCNDLTVHRGYWHPEKGSWAEKKLMKRPEISRFIVIGRDTKINEENGE